MKKNLLFLIIMMFCALSANSQRLAIGEKAPDIKVSEWLTGAPSSGKATLIDFFHSSNDQCVKALAKDEEIAKKYPKLNVVVLNKEGFDKVEKYLNKNKGYHFYMGFDEGKVFTAYDVRFVPFTALVDSHGKLVWTGNVNALTNDIIEKALK